MCPSQTPDTICWYIWQKLKRLTLQMKGTQNRSAFLCDISKSGNAANFTVNAFVRKARWENKLKEFLNCDVVA